MTIHVSALLRARVAELDRARCAYCRTSESISGVPLTLDHILPVTKGGRSVLDNLCLACRSCNEFKADNTAAIDPLTQELVALFNARERMWSEHFAWSDDGTRIEGKTAVGRASVVALRMNNAVVVAARRRWAIVSWHPPPD